VPGGNLIKSFAAVAGRKWREYPLFAASSDAQGEAAEVF